MLFDIDAHSMTHSSRVYSNHLFTSKVILHSLFFIFLNNCFKKIILSIKYKQIIDFRMKKLFVFQIYLYVYIKYIRKKL